MPDPVISVPDANKPINFKKTFQSFYFKLVIAWRYSRAVQSPN